MTVRRSLRLRPEISAVVPDTAMVMAAGLGKRMRPLTASRPKPLVELAGKPLIDHVLDRLRAAGVGKLVVNVHYLADSLEAHLATKARDFDVTISDERDLAARNRRRTGQSGADDRLRPVPGGQQRQLLDRRSRRRVETARQRMGRREDGCAAAAGAHRRGPAIIAGRAISGWIASAGSRRRARSRVAPYVFTGIQIISKRLLADAPAGPFSTNILWDRAIEAGRCFGLVHQGMWFDVGTPKSIKDTEAALANE